jgi:hypothetical protein
VHAQASCEAATDWARIVGLYDLLLRLEPSPVVELNRAVAVAMNDGPAAGLVWSLIMQYLLMCCFDEKRWEELPDSQRDKIMAQYQALEQDLIKSGHYRGGAKLGPSSSATNVRLKNGKPAISDGPFAETKEQIGGYHLIECENLDEAIAIAMRIPTLPAGGAIEVRPVEHVIQI